MTDSTAGTASESLGVDSSLIQDAKNAGLSDSDIAEILKGDSEETVPVVASEIKPDSKPDAEQDAEPVKAEAKPEAKKAPDASDIESRLARLERSNRELQGDRDRWRELAKQRETTLQATEKAQQEAERRQLLSMTDEERGAYLRSRLEQPRTEADMQKEAYSAVYRGLVSDTRRFFQADDEWKKELQAIGSLEELTDWRDKLVTNRAQERLRAEIKARGNDAAAKARKAEVAVPDGGEISAAPGSYDALLQGWVDDPSDEAFKAVAAAGAREGRLDKDLVAMAAPLL